MLTRIARGPSAPTDDVVASLLECHGRIRNFLRTAGRILTARAPDAQIAEAASAVETYFRVALPLHAADEDLSIVPRLVDAGAPESLRAALGRMTREHEAIERLLDALGPRWAALAREPAALSAHHGPLGRDVADLGAIFDTHLAVEETVIFPAVRRLPLPEQQALRAEMRSRRGQAR